MAKTSKTQEDPLRKLTKERFLKFLTIDTRQTFLLVQPLLENNTKAVLSVATFIFAGSLTFLGLRKGLHDLIWLQWSWGFLGLSVLSHLLVQLAILDALMAHGRVETDNARAIELLNANGLKEFAKEAFSSFYNDKKFRQSSAKVIWLLVLQNVSLIVGGVAIGLFVLINL